MKLVSKNTPEAIHKLRWPKDAAFIAGMVRNPNGEQNPFNYGSRPHFFTSYFQGPLQFIIWRIGLKHKELGGILRTLANPVIHSFPNIYKPAKKRQIFWAAESNMIIKSVTFEELNGYDPDFRYSEIIDFSIRIHRLGLKAYFDPRIDTLHATLDNVLKRRKQRYTAHKQFLRKYGRLNFYAPKLADHLVGRKTQKRYHR